MKRKLFLLLIFTIFKISAESNSYILKISGVISKEYEFEMNLKILENSVYGYYSYKKYKTKIPLIGKINHENSEIILIENPWVENDLNNPIIGFKMKISENITNGIWFNKTEKKELVVSGKLETEKVQVSKNEGNYKSLRNSEKFDGNIELIYIYDKFFLFYISTATESGCIGEVYGIIRIENDKGKFSKELCKELTIEIENENLFIDENECEYHGYSCYFYGKYIKQQS